MEPETKAPGNPMWMTVLGWIFTLLVAAFLVMSAFLKVAPPEAMEAMIAAGNERIGWRDSSMLGLAIVEIGCAMVFLFPETALLGAVLLTGYLGGAVATHVRLGDAFLPPIGVVVAIWLALFLRDPRLRGILPLRSTAPDAAPTGGFLSALAKVFVTLVVVIAAIAAIVAAQPSHYRITRTISIDAPPSKVFEHVNDFRKWNAWSPFVELDPDAKYTFEGPTSGAGAILKWSGDKAGEGLMTIDDSRPSERVLIKLEFIRPVPSVAEVDFSFKALGDQTMVTWSMSGERDFVGKCFCALQSMDQLIGGLYEKGLANMKKVVEGKK